MAEQSPGRDKRERLQQAIEKTRSGDDLSPESVRKELEDTAIDETSAHEAERYLEKTHTEGSGFRTRTATNITDFAEASEIPEDLLESSYPTRYELDDLIGKGAAGRIYALQDHSLNRTVAVKFLQKSREMKKGVKRQFINEARVTAMLEHPNIMPVYDIGATEKGELYFCMKKVSGFSVGDAIRAAIDGQEMPEDFETCDGRVRMFLKVCDALAYAHSRGYIHQDIKPDNLMLGEYGEVLVLDWGSALNLTAKGPGGRNLYGTPAYMSPEQARREHADERSDVYCVGATFFHALTLRHPTWAEDPDEFWEKKRRGEVDMPTDEEERKIPKALLRIALKALEADPSKRYQSMQDLAEDLKRYQAGMAVSAHRETWLETFLRWYRKRRTMFWTVTGFLAVVAVVGYMLGREKIKEMITWSPFFSDNFAYSSTGQLVANWKGYQSTDWQNFRLEPFTDDGGWRIEDGALHGYNTYGCSNITFNRLIPGDMRVEWTATAIRQPVNLNCYIAAQNRTQGYTFHVGGFGDPGLVRLTKGRNLITLQEYRGKQSIELSVPIKYRMEKEGPYVRFFRDGKKLIEYKDIDPPQGENHQTFGFENNQGNHIRIDDLQVYYHPLPLKVSPLGAADRFFQHGHYREALIQYSEIATLYADYDIAKTAEYKMGACLLQMDSTAAALEQYARFELRHPKHELAPLAMFERYRIHESRGDTAKAELVLRDMGARYPGHQVLKTILVDMTQKRRTEWRRLSREWAPDYNGDTTVFDWCVRESRKIQEWGRVFSVSVDNNLFLSEMTRVVYDNRLRDFDSIQARYPAQRQALAALLNSTGRHPRVLEDFQDIESACASALAALGEYRRILRQYPEQRRLCADALLQLGRYEDVLRRYPDQSNEMFSALFALGRLEEAIRRYPDKAGSLLMDLGRYDEYLNFMRSAPISLASALTSSGLPDSALQVLGQTWPGEDNRYWLHLKQALVEQGRAEQVIQQYSRFRQMPDMVADVYVHLGRTRDALTVFPYGYNLRANAFKKLGMYDSVYAYPDDVENVRSALWQENRLREVLKRYAEYRPLCAAALLGMNRFKQVVDKYPEQREACAKALYRLRQYNEILKQYPGQRGLCAQALYRMGKAEEAFRLYPESRARYATYLIQEGRHQAVVDSFTDQTLEYSLALMHLGRADAAPIDHGFPRLKLESKIVFQGMRALHACRQGDRAAAYGILEKDLAFYHVFAAHRFQHFLLEPVLKALDGDRMALRRACRLIRERYPETLSQRLRYEASLLCGDIDEIEFMAQPYKYFARERFVLLQAIMLDIDGDRERALQKYQAIAGAPQCRNPDLLQVTDISDLSTIFHSPVVQEFVDWRIEELTQETGKTSARRGARERVLVAQSGN